MSIFRPANILIPNIPDMNAWSVVACDQFTSEPEYWADVYRIAENKPSALHLILPEAELGIKDPETESVKINEKMTEYLYDGVFTEHRDSFVLVERTLADGTLRRGIIGAFDLEAYDWHDGTAPLIRATERTVEDRLPPRVKVRENAVIEMPHIMIFMDDPENTVLNSVTTGKVLYDFELMQGGGHIKGSLISDNAALSEAIDGLSDPACLEKKYGSADAPMIFAMGDGNHSIAAAKLHWENVKKTLSREMYDTCPARYALAELVNIHDDAIVFEPIHRVVFDTDASGFLSCAGEYFAGNTGDGREVTFIAGDKSVTLTIGGMTIGELIGACEDFCAAYVNKHGGRIDYIHGDEVCAEMSARDGCAGIMLPKMEKSELFASVIKSGPFPKKSFSIGHGPDKRYYLECRKIK